MRGYGLSVAGFGLRSKGDVSRIFARRRYNAKPFARNLPNLSNFARNWQPATQGNRKVAGRTLGASGLCGCPNPQPTYPMPELPDNVIWLEDAGQSRYVHKYERQSFAVGDVATFFDYDPEGGLDYDTAVTCRVIEDEVLGLVARLV